MVRQMSRQHKICALSVYAEKLLERQWVRDRCLASKGATDVGCCVLSYRVTILKEWDMSSRPGRCPSGDPKATTWKG